MPILTVVLRLHQNSEQIDWLTIDSDGAVSQIRQETALKQLEFPADDFQAIAIVPGAQLTLTNIKAPPTSYSKLLQAIPFMAENELAENPENFYFAIGNRNEDDSLNIAYTTHQQMKAWIDLLAANDSKPNFMLPDILIIPYAEKTWQIFIEGQIALVRTNYQLGFTCELVNLPLILIRALQQNKNQLPNKIYIIGQAINKEQFSDINIPIEFTENKSDLLTYAAQELTKPPALNLLQGRYKTEKRFIKLSRRWHTTLALGTIFLALFIFGHLSLFIKLKIEQYYLNNQTTKLLMQAVPNATSAINAKQQVTNELRKYQGNPEGANFLMLMSRIGNTTSKMPIIKITEATFNNNKIVIKISADSFNSLDQFIGKLREQNISVTQNEATTKDKLVLATLTIGLLS